MIFWLLYPILTFYLYQQWQRYEPTKVPIDGAAAVAAFVFAAAVMLGVS